MAMGDWMRWGTLSKPSAGGRTRPAPPGWYEKEGTLRYYDGDDWTDNVAPPPVSAGRIAAAVFAGVLAALFVVWVGAQIDSDHIYYPVKFVVEEAPSGF